MPITSYLVAANVTLNETPAHFTYLLNVRDNISVMISFTECFGIIVVGVDTCNISVSAANVLLGPASSKCFICLHDTYHVVCHIIMLVTILVYDIHLYLKWCQH